MNSERTISEVEGELGITAKPLWKWKENLDKQPKKRGPFPRNGEYGFRGTDPTIGTGKCAFKEDKGNKKVLFNAA